MSRASKARRSDRVWSTRCGEVGVVRELRDAGAALELEERTGRGGDVLALADVPAQGPAVQVREVLDVVEVHAVTTDERVDGRAGVVVEVLVVDRVELAVLDEVLHPRVLDRDQPVVGEQDRHAADEVVELWHVRHHVVRDDHVGRAVLGADPLGELDAEELLARSGRRRLRPPAPGRVPGRRPARGRRAAGTP